MRGAQSALSLHRIFLCIVCLRCRGCGGTGRGRHSHACSHGHGPFTPRNVSHLTEAPSGSGSACTAHPPRGTSRAHVVAPTTQAPRTHGPHGPCSMHSLGACDLPAAREGPHCLRNSPSRLVLCLCLLLAPGLEGAPASALTLVHPPQATRQAARSSMVRLYSGSSLVSGSHLGPGRPSSEWRAKWYVSRR